MTVANVDMDARITLGDSRSNGFRGADFVSNERAKPIPIARNAQKAFRLKVTGVVTTAPRDFTAIAVIGRTSRLLCFFILVDDVEDRQREGQDVAAKEQGTNVKYRLALNDDGTSRDRRHVTRMTRDDGRNTHPWFESQPQCYGVRNSLVNEQTDI